MYTQYLRMALAVLIAALLPTLRAQAPERNIVQTAQAAGSFETLLAAVRAAGLAETLSGAGPFTVLAPTDEAFGRLPQGTLADLLRPESKGRLKDILKLHVIAGSVTGEQALRAGQARPLLAGESLNFELKGGRLLVNGANVVNNDVSASNGVIHAIDALLLPPEPELTPAEECRAIIALAVKRGAPLFNDGSPEACAAVYEVTATSLLSIGPAEVVAAARPILAAALAEGRKAEPRQRAWTLRRALDRTWDLLEEAAEARQEQPSERDQVSSDGLPRSGSGYVMASWSQIRDRVLTTLEEATSSRGSVDDLATATRRATVLLGPDSLTAKRLLQAIEKAEITRDRSDLEREMRAVLEDLGFEPRREAELPEGFPEPTPVGEVQIKRYPAYRMAVADMGNRSRGSSNGSFFRLFNHIKKNEIAMTAPVQMDYPDAGNATMAFLYQSTSQGKAGSDGNVKVIDVAPGMTASIGIRGRLDRETVERARAQLGSWLKARSDRYRPTGVYRTMGWNSPFVPSDQRYSEVQILIEPVSADG